MTSFGLNIVNGNKKLISMGIVKPNDKLDVLLTSHHQLISDVKASVWILKRHLGGKDTYCLELAVGELRPRLIQSVSNPKAWCSASATRREREGYRKDDQALW